MYYVLIVSMQIYLHFTNHWLDKNKRKENINTVSTVLQFSAILQQQLKYSIKAFITPL